MRKLLLALAALAASAIAVPLGFASSHREAPDISLDPSADNTDTYAWTAKDAPGALTSRPTGFPARCRRTARTSSGSTTGPATTSTSTTPVTAVLTSATGSSSRRQVRNKESFLYALPGASGYNDPKLNVIQRYSIVREHVPRQEPEGPRQERRSPADCRWLRRTSARRRSRTTSTFVSGAIRSLNDGTKVFVGQRDDPFFVDLGATFDGINVRKLTGNQGEGKDDLSGNNIHSVVLQIPERHVTQEPARPSPGPTPPTRWWACGRPPSAASSRCSDCRAQARHRVAGSRSRASATRS